MNHAPYFTGKRAIVTGGIGSVGRKIVHELRALSLQTIRVIDNNESGVFEMEQEFRSCPDIEFYVADICDEREMMRMFDGMDLCFHAAALKHVPSCERSPFTAINVNVTGCGVISRAALENGLERVIFTSSDKAVNPTNVMGTSKLMGERLFTSLNFMRSRKHHTLFSSTRFGNVLGSRGSVVPLFCRQIADGGPVTVTDHRMTRFVMTVEDAARLVVRSMAIARGGEVFVTKMPVLAVSDLVAVMVEMIAPSFGRQPSDVEVKIVGARPGEKLWEELSSDEESRRLLETEDFLVILPALATKAQCVEYRYEGLDAKPSEVVYHSDKQNRMSRSAIRMMLMQPGVLPEYVRMRLDLQSDPVGAVAAMG